MKNLILDFDNTQFDTLPVLARYINEIFGIESLPEDHRDLTTDKILEKYGRKTSLTSDQLYYYFIKNFQTSITWHDFVKPMPGLTEVLPRLTSEYNIYTCSSRQTQGIHNIRRLSEIYIPGCIKDIHCVWTYTKSGYIGVSKAEFIKNLAGENVMLVDDSRSELSMVKDLIPKILFGKSDDDNHEFVSAKDWWEVEKILESAF